VEKNDSKPAQTEVFDAETMREAEAMAGLNAASGGDLFKAIDELRIAGAGSAICVTYRHSPADKKGYCGPPIAVSEFSLEKMRTLYGPGRYMVQIKGPKGFLPGGGPVEIAEGVETPKAAGGTDIAALLEMMDRRDREAKTANSEKLSRLTELGIPALTTLLAAFIARPQGTDVAALVTALKPAPGPTLADITATMNNLQTLTGGNKTADPLDQLIRVAEAVKNLAGEGGGGEGKSTWVDVLRDLVREAVPAVKPMLENLATAQQQEMQRRANQPPLQIQPIPRVAVPSPIAVSQPLPTTSTSGAESVESVTSASDQSATPGGSEMIEIFLPLIRQQLVKITQWAISDYNPQTYAEVFVNELPPMVGNYLKPEDALTQLNRVDWFEQVVNFHAMLKPYHAWCDEFRQELIVLVTELMDESANDQTQTIAKPKTVQPQIVDEFKDTGE
jgi:hypothetical protein